MEYWIQRADFKVMEGPAGSARELADLFERHDWAGELELAGARAESGHLSGLPGFGVTTEEGRLLQLCPHGDGTMVCMYIPAKGHQERRDGARSWIEDESGGRELIEHFVADRHDELMDRWRTGEPLPEPTPSGFGEVLFSGSRFIRRALAPVIAIAFVALPLMQSEWNPTKTAMMLAIEAALLLLFVALVWPRHAPWAGGIVTLMVFLSYVAFLAEALSTDGDSSLGALLGLVFIGLPSLFLSIRLLRRLGHRR